LERHLGTIRAMQSARTLRRRELKRRYLDHELRFSEPLTRAMASGEARGLFAAIGRNGETIDSVRELICLDPESRKVLENFAAAQPAESVWVLRVMEFRERVLEQFERLVQSQSRRSRRA
jgi:hypothetical protein